MRFIQVAYTRARDILAPGAGKEFLRNAGMTTIAFGLSGAFTFLANVLAARWLGRDLYGTYELMFRASQLIGIFCLFGMTTATTKFLASEEGKEGQILRTATTIVLIQTVVALFLIFLFRGQIQEVAHLPSGVIELALVFTAGYVLKELVSGMLRGLHWFTWLAWVTGVYGGVVLLSLAAITLFVDVPLYEWYAAAYLLAFFVFLVPAFRLIPVAKKARWDSSQATALIAYSLLTGAGWVGWFVLGAIDRFILNGFFDASEVGLYSAYFAATGGLVAIFLQVIVSVLFPTIAKKEDKKGSLRSIEKALPWLLLGMIIVIGAASVVILWLYGEEFPIVPSLLAPFVLSAALSFGFQLFMWLLNAEGKKGAMQTTIGTLLAVLINLGGNFALIPSMGIMGAIVTTVAANVFLLFFFWWRARRLYAS